MKRLFIFLTLCCVSSFGFVTQEEITPIVGGLSGVGRTTRYWDCCKPACGWDIAFNNTKITPAKTCAKNGVTKIDKNTKSACQDVAHNDAYMCNDEQPFVINNKLAYGFVAFSTGGGVDLKKCCSCMRLKFQGALLGKEMVVQVTNTGGDLYEYHFDIAIPGGGVGIFNGCQKQWNASKDGWGDRITGVRNRQECDTLLPAQLRSGCHFRFDFMEGVPNPDVHFEEVKCPRELTQRSGCILP